MNDDIRELIAIEQGVDLTHDEDLEIGWAIKLTYFKQTGKYYTDGSYTTLKEFMYEVSDEIKAMRDQGKLPGINGKEWIIHVEPADDHPNAYPLLILPREEA